MPDRVAVFQLGLLLLAVPLQYFISRHYSHSQAERSQTLRKLLNGVGNLKKSYLTWESWEKWCRSILGSLEKYGKRGSKGKRVVVNTDSAGDLQGESPAVEVMKYNDPNGYFAGSPEPRTERPREVKYRVGQVIRHKKWGYRGVIIGWDLHARAPEHWLAQNHPAAKTSWRTQPNYAILVDTRDRMTPQMTYVPQENIEPLVNVQVIHPNIENYFESFDGAQYLPRPSLRKIYPRD